MSEPAATYARRRDKVVAYLKREGIAAARFADFERARDPAVRYLCGHPGDAFLFLTAEGASLLVPWDINMARSMAHVDAFVAYGEFGRKPELATKAALETLGLPRGTALEISASTSFPAHASLKAALEGWELMCRDSGIDAELLRLRSVKDEGELAIYEKASALTDVLMDAIEAGVRDGSLVTEKDVALFIEAEGRSAGAEGTGFDTIAAGPSRSFGIHAFPNYGSGPFGTAGLSILDFGIKVEGYTTDVTMTFARGPLSEPQERMLDLVERAYSLAVAACGPGVPTRAPAEEVDRFFASAGFAMPHALGHGIGLEAHESPGLNLRPENGAVLEPGCIVTIEPGLYHPEFGGARLENDLLITPQGVKVLTSSRIVRL